MKLTDVSYHKKADQFLIAFYEKNALNSIFCSYRFNGALASEAKQIAKSLSLQGMDYQNAIVATWFRYAGTTQVAQQDTRPTMALLNEYFNWVAYPEQERITVKNIILDSISNKDAETDVQRVVYDAINSQLASYNFLENILLINEEVNRLTATDKTELYYAEYFLNIAIRSRYYTEYAKEKYSIQRERNFQLLEKRVDKLREAKISLDKDTNKVNGGLLLNKKETEDLFKIAFRNYNHLISVADSKASLLIHVNSIIISVMLAFVLSRIEKNMFLLWPAVLLLSVCMVTILLSILASKPQKNSLVEDKESLSYQKFFFGSFDLIDTKFQLADWDRYYREINELFNNSKEGVYLEVYKESFNVRIVLSKKFNYLSRAYTVFIVGLLVSVIAFLWAIRSQIAPI